MSGSQEHAYDKTGINFACSFLLKMQLPAKLACGKGQAICVFVGGQFFNLQVFNKDDILNMGHVLAQFVSLSENTSQDMSVA